MGKWKGYVPNYKKGDLKMELYDLDVDPREQNNLAPKNPRIVKKLLKKMNEAHRTPEIKQFDME